MSDPFLTELKALLVKHMAEINIENFWTGYPECGSDNRMIVEFSDFRRPEIDLGTSIGYNDK